jgi:hypothetical protein
MNKELHFALKNALGHCESETTKDILDMWKAITASICKPCWELKYCPYGPLVEQFPLLPPPREEAESHNSYLTECLRSGRLANGDKLDSTRRRSFKEMVDTFDPSAYPDEIPEIFQLVSCRIFGHICPVFFTAEPPTETKQTRRHGRYISRDVMLKVVRRDGQVCQACHKYVPDNELDFDHIIPHSKGGPVTVDNLRVMHSRCNRKKRDSLEDILDPHPLSKHLVQAK